MTRIDRVQRPPPPAIAKAGLVLPGLGHLLTGAVAPGVAMLGSELILIWALVAGLPRLGSVTGLTELQLSWHGLLAVLTVVVVHGLQVAICWRHVNPLPPDPERDNSNRAIFLREFLRNRNGMIGVAGAAWLIVVTLVAPMIAPFDPDAVGVGPQLGPPGWLHLMGTDEYGRDMFSRTLLGARVSMFIGFLAVTIAATIGTTVGAIAGWYGGVVDRLLMWIVDLLLALPRLILLLAIVGLFRPKGVWAIVMIVTMIGLMGWMGVSRIVRSQILSLRRQEFVQAAVAMGMSDRRIIIGHLIPNAMAPVIVYCTLAVGGTMLAEASLSFLGLGVQPPTATWGTLVADGRDQLRNAPWIAVFPGFAIVCAVMAFNLLGDGLRDALDPKTRAR